MPRRLVSGCASVVPAIVQALSEGPALDAVTGRRLPPPIQGGVSAIDQRIGEGAAAATQRLVAAANTAEG